MTNKDSLGSRGEPHAPHTTGGEDTSADPNMRTQLLNSTAVPAPRLFFTIARSKNGKSFLTKLMCERAQAAGRDPILCDCDRDNATLTSHFGEANVLRPKAASTVYFEQMLMSLIEKQKVEGRDAVVDLGFGMIHEFRNFCRNWDLGAVLEEYGIRSVVIAPLAPNVDDLPPLASTLEVFKPDDLLVLFNEGLLDSTADFQIEYTSFYESAETEILFGARSPKDRSKRLAPKVSKNAPRVMWLPRMKGGGRFFNTRQPFARVAGTDWRNPLNPFERQGALRFLQTVDKLFNDLAPLLP